LIYSTPGQYAVSVIVIGVSDPMHIRTIVEDALRKFKEIKKIQEDLGAPANVSSKKALIS
jgi:hypothetical protein